MDDIRVGGGEYSYSYKLVAACAKVVQIGW